jgi:hypothetical protein
VSLLRRCYYCCYCCCCCLGGCRVPSGHRCKWCPWRCT